MGVVAKRLYFLDFIRGIAIIGVVINHAIVYGIMKDNSNAMKYLPHSPLVIFAPAMIFATWAGLFSLINGLGVGYSVYSKLEAGIPLKQALKSPLINSTSLLIIHFLFQLVFTRRFTPILGEEPWFSMGTGSILQSQFISPDLRILFRSDALSSIAMSGYLACLVMALLWRVPQNFRNSKRNNRILLELGAIWLAISPTLWKFLYYRYFIPSLETGGILYIPALFLSLISPFGHGILPYGAYTLAGLLFGFSLAQNQHRKIIRRKAKQLGIALIFMGMLIILFHILTVHPITLQYFFKYIVIPPDLYVLNLGFMICLFQWLIGKFETQETNQTAPIIYRTKWIQDLGRFTLTLFCWENIWSSMLRLIIIQLFDFLPHENDVLMENFELQLLYLAAYCAFWLIFLHLWKRISFKFGMEWLVARLNFFLGLRSPIQIKEDSLKKTVTPNTGLK